MAMSLNPELDSSILSFMGLLKASRVYYMVLLPHSDVEGNFSVQLPFGDSVLNKLTVR